MDRTTCTPFSSKSDSILIRSIVLLAASATADQDVAEDVPSRRYLQIIEQNVKRPNPYEIVKPWPYGSQRDVVSKSVRVDYNPLDTNVNSNVNGNNAMKIANLMSVMAKNSVADQNAGRNGFGQEVNSQIRMYHVPSSENQNSFSVVLKKRMSPEGEIETVEYKVPDQYIQPQDLRSNSLNNVQSLSSYKITDTLREPNKFVAEQEFASSKYMHKAPNTYIDSQLKLGSNTHDEIRDESTSGSVEYKEDAELNYIRAENLRGGAYSDEYAKEKRFYESRSNSLNHDQYKAINQEAGYNIDGQRQLDPTFLESDIEVVSEKKENYSPYDLYDKRENVIKDRYTYGHSPAQRYQNAFAVNNYGSGRNKVKPYYGNYFENYQQPQIVDTTQSMKEKIDFNTESVSPDFEYKSKMKNYQNYVDVQQKPYGNNELDRFKSTAGYTHYENPLTRVDKKQNYINYEQQYYPTSSSVRDSKGSIKLTELKKNNVNYQAGTVLQEFQDTEEFKNQYNSKVNFVAPVDKWGQTKEETLSVLERGILIDLIAQSINKFRITLKELQVAGARFGNMQCAENGSLLRRAAATKLAQDDSNSNSLKFKARQTEKVKSKLNIPTIFGNEQIKTENEDDVETQFSVKEKFSPNMNNNNQFNYMASDKKLELMQSQQLPLNYQEFIIGEQSRFEPAHLKEEQGSYQFTSVNNPTGYQTGLYQGNKIDFTSLGEQRIIDQRVPYNREVIENSSNERFNEEHKMSISGELSGSNQNMPAKNYQNLRYKAQIKDDYDRRDSQTIKNSIFINNKYNLNNVNDRFSIASILKDSMGSLSDEEIFVMQLNSIDQNNNLPLLREKLIELLKMIRSKWTYLQKFISIILKLDNGNCFVNSDQLKALFNNQAYSDLEMTKVGYGNAYMKYYPCRIGTQMITPCDRCFCKYNGILVCQKKVLCGR
uniref:Uncharacterized protein n=1 Tax=Bombyx mori TaxID=7091 RepID=A0A8R2DK31_BOMMO|nr:uncharacterized protein LOC105841524 isoform X2 [Bombyx mori]